MPIPPRAAWRSTATPLKPASNMEVSDILAERQKTHGSFGDHAEVAQAIKDIMHDSKNWSSLTPVYKEGLEMIAHKIARICSGTPYHADHIDDVMGYAKLMRDSIK